MLYSLPDEVKSADDLVALRSHLKTRIFYLTYSYQVVCDKTFPRNSNDEFIVSTGFRNPVKPWGQI